MTSSSAVRAAASRCEHLVVERGRVLVLLGELLGVGQFEQDFAAAELGVGIGRRELPGSIGGAQRRHAVFKPASRACGFIGSAASASAGLRLPSQNRTWSASFGFLSTSGVSVLAASAILLELHLADSRRAGPLRARAASRVSPWRTPETRQGFAELARLIEQQAE